MQKGEKTGGRLGKGSGMEKQICQEGKNQRGQLKNLKERVEGTNQFRGT